ncbi:thiol-disulfide oxidoreductase ResA [Siminovitchia acidinfaciens]|uniref:Thiol-disulfide oxidoreductase ResA n=1 Tax=Siminovitchia acidinfaciens TaxID=2321395 RepID=A0A429Y3Z6_9BACI|nr:thiol-disulfide oxidoreductase ResA [Siminovitchia acidinfaciens]RST76118.1 thiol-disulfide oxidoreductase ResA [Siminovitchia acidinfaciens]
MKKKKRLIMRSVILAIMVTAIVYTLYNNFTKEARGQLAIGDKAPDFILSDMNGNTHKLSDYEGEGVFLNFWGTWCKPCEREMPYMENQYQVFKDQGVEILAVNVGEPEFAINKFVQKHGLNFPILKDTNKEVLNLYKITPLPTTILINSEGIITAIESGELPEAKIKGMMESIQPH